jgi:carbon monoxide dehydrogenase subunit G
MKRVFTSSCSIARPKAEVFELLCHPEEFSNFIPAIKEAHWESNSSPLLAGKVYVETREAFGKQATAKVHISQLEVPHKIAFKSTAAGVTGEYVYSLIQQSSGNTQVILEAFADASGFAKLILPFFSGAMKRQDSGQLALLKKFAEAKH